MDNVIQQLKKNEKPFGLMSEEMQVKAREIGQPEFEMYMKDDTWMTCGHCNNFGSKKVTDQTYHLRPDYEEEPEIVECEIFEDSNCLGFDGCKGIQGTEIANAVNHPDNIGFKFEDGTWYDHPIKPVSKGSSAPIHNIDTDDIISGRAEVLHATHVLFRQKPKE